MYLVSLWTDCCCCGWEAIVELPVFGKEQSSSMWYVLSVLLSIVDGLSVSEGTSFRFFT